MIASILQTVPIGSHQRLHRNGNEQVGCLANLYAGEACPGHSDHGQSSSIHNQLLVQNGRVVAEMARPVAVAQDCKRVGTGSGLVLRVKNSA